jgi:hypothetical protein
MSTSRSRAIRKLCQPKASGFDFGAGQPVTGHLQD